LCNPPTAPSRTLAATRAAANVLWKLFSAYYGGDESTVNSRKCGCAAGATIKLRRRVAPSGQGLQPSAACAADPPSPPKIGGLFTRFARLNYGYRR